MIKLLRPTLLGMLLLVLAGLTHAENKASIQGTIVEKRGYVMAGLTVTARNASTGTEYQATSRPGAGSRFAGPATGRLR